MRSVHFPIELHNYQCKTPLSRARAFIFASSDIIPVYRQRVYALKLIKSLARVENTTNRYIVILKERVNEL